MLSRRDVMSLLPALAVPATAAQDTPAARLPGKIYHAAQIPYTGDEKKKGRRFFRGTEHSGFNLEAHETVLGPGMAPHPPHSHEHEEIIVVAEGAVEVTMGGRVDTAETGSVIYYEPNTPHGLRNAGSVTARYYVIELRGRNA